jgi:hypothetical protein
MSSAQILATKPPPTGLATTVNTIGTLRVACCNGPKALPLAAAYLRIRAYSITSSARLEREGGRGPEPKDGRPANTLSAFCRITA